MDGALKDLSRWPTLISIVTLKPVLNFHYFRQLLLGSTHFLSLSKDIVLLDLLCLRLPSHLAEVIVALSFALPLVAGLGRVGFPCLWGRSHSTIEQRLSELRLRLCILGASDSSPRFDLIRIDRYSPQGLL